jgi:serine/threonine-protein kinase
MPSPLLAEQLAPRFVIYDEIGAGAMSQVFLATDTTRSREVAIKVLRSELAQATDTRRFHREIAILARLEHPNILPVLESGSAGDALFYVMPYVAGETLGQRLLRTGPLPVETTIDIAGDIAAAIDHAHASGIMHRDIKPDNVMLGEQGALLCDFGIARALTVATGEQITLTGLMVGTPEYMSPEQATGLGEINGRTDIYGLGCVLYEMLTGQPPFTGSTPLVIINRHRLQPPRSIRVVRPDVPEHVERAIHSAMSKSQNMRPASGAELMEMLRG